MMHRWFSVTLTSIVLLACSADSAPNFTNNDDLGAGAVGNPSGGGETNGGSGGQIGTGSGFGGFNPSGGAGGCGPEDPECECEELSFSVDTMQSCSLDILAGFEMDGEGFITLESMDHRVFALDRWGDGHIIAWCDGTTAGQLTAAFDAFGYLGQVADPKAAAFGDNFLCQDSYQQFPGDVPYLGEDLPSMYQNNATQLAADYDIIVLCGFRIDWPNDWSAELEEFVAVHGKGLLAVGEYEGGVATNQDFTELSKITSPSGIVFNPLNLDWAPASTTVLIECVPDLPPPPN